MSAQRRNFTIIIVLLGLGLAGSVAYNIYNNSRQNKKIADASAENDELEFEIEELEENVFELESIIEDQNTSLEEKETLRQEQEEKIEQLRKQLAVLRNSNRISEEQAKKYEATIERQQYYLKKYQGRISELEAEVEGLRAETATLTGKLGAVGKQRDSLEMAALKTQNTLDAASFLVVNKTSFKFFRVKNSGKEIEDVEFRSGRLEKLKICFTINANLATKAGKRNIYVQILDPSGKVVMDQGGQSGYFSTNGQNAAYTIKKSLDYDRTSTQVCMAFTKPDALDWKDGNHRVVIYDDNTDIGRSSFTIK